MWNETPGEGGSWFMKQSRAVRFGRLRTADFPVGSEAAAHVDQGGLSERARRTRSGLISAGSIWPVRSVTVFYIILLYFLYIYTR